MKTFQDFAASKGVDLQASTPREGIEAMLDFRAQTQCNACFDDMLLYQCGGYDRGKGKYFELNITRQFIAAQREDDDAISQLNFRTDTNPALMCVRWVRVTAGRIGHQTAASAFLRRVHAMRVPTSSPIRSI